MTKAPRDTQARKKGEGKTEKRREKENEKGEGRRGRRLVFPATKQRPATPQQAKKEEGEGKGRKGIKVPAAPAMYAAPN